MRFRWLASLSVLSIISGGLLSLVSMAWLSSSNAVSSNVHLQNYEKRYQLQIKHLKQALQRSEQILAHERALAAGLQRELHDAHSQIDGMSETLVQLKALGAKLRKQLEEATEKSDLRAVPEMPGSFGVASPKVSFNTVSAIKETDSNARISPYAPRLKVAAKTGRARTPSPNTSRSVVASLSKRSPGAAGKRQAVVAAVKPSVEKKKTQSQIARTSYRLPRFDAKRKKPSYVGASATRAPAQAARQQAARSARLRRIAKIKRVQQRRAQQRRVQKRQVSQLYRRKRAQQRQVKKPKPNLFGKLARQGVFGAGYSLE